MAVVIELMDRNYGRVEEVLPELGPDQTHLTWIEVENPEQLNYPIVHQRGVALFFDRDAHRAKQAESWPFPKKQAK